MGAVGPDIILMIVVFAIAISAHESAHAYVAYRCGDSTAKRKGRISMNPVDHVDPFGTILLPALLIISGAPFLFGWAKPVPVNQNRLRNPRRDRAYVSVAGPAANLALALVSIVVTIVFYPLLVSETIELSDALRKFLYYNTMINLVLAVFNMIPVAPLDGGGVLQYFLSRRQARWMQENRTLLIVMVFALFLLGVFNVILRGFSQVFLGFQQILIQLIWF